LVDFQFRSTINNPMISKKIDETDARILNLLQSSGRMKRIDMAARVGLSMTSVSDRMRKLEENGYLTGYHATVNSKALGFDITAFIRVSVDTSTNYEALIEHVCGCSEVLEAHSVTGEGSHILKVRSHDTTSLERLLASIQSWPGVTGTRTSIVLSTFKETRQLPISPDEGTSKRQNRP